MTKKILLISIITFIFTTLTTYLSAWYLDTKDLLISPSSDILNPVGVKLGLTHRPKKVVIGFLPYWNLKYADSFQYHLLTHTAYFGVDYEPDGRIKTRDEDGYTEPGWNNLNKRSLNQIFRRTKSNGGKTILVMRGMTQGLIESIVNNPNTRKKAINNTIDLYLEKDFNGINIDFEYVGTPDQRIRDNFANFVEETKNACKKVDPECEISIDVFGDSARNYRIWDFAQITPHVDYVIIMAYDYFRSSSTQAGPVAPLRGSCSSSLSSTKSKDCLNEDISRALSEFTKIIPAEKIILGVPYYGYEWRTANKEFLSNTYDGTGGIATYKRVKDLISENQPSFTNPKTDVLGFSTNWSDQTLTPWITYTDNYGRINQIHYEDVNSLSLKYDLVNQTDIAGIAIWALGYDGDNLELWQLLQEKFAQ